MTDDGRRKFSPELAEGTNDERRGQGIRPPSSVVRLFSLLIALSLLLPACGNLPEQKKESLFPSPVAFVTAGPLPESSPTPTLPPIATATIPPPTAVPKRLPLDSTAAIGLWSDQITSTAAFTGVVDLAAGPPSLELRKTNLALVTLTEKQVNWGYGDTISDVVNNHPKWLLYDKNGKVVLGTASGQPVLNIREDEIKQQLADAVAKQVTDGGYDGIVIGGVGDDLIRSSATPMYTGTKAFTDEQRRAAAEGLLRAIRAKIPDKLLVMGGYAWRDGLAYNASTTDSSDLASLGDGVYIEEFLRNPISGTTDYKSETNWKKDVDYLAATSQDGKLVLIATRLNASGFATDTIKQWLSYSVASYLLGKNGPHTYFQFDVGGTLAYSTDPVLSAPVGTPQEAYSKLESGIYRRTFSNGIVLVNPTGDNKETDLGAEYRTLSGATVQKVSMSAHTGLILLK